MATLARCNFAVTDDAGNVVNGASVRVVRESDAALVSLYSDRTGLSSLGNPFTATDGRDAGFYVAGGAYKITATKGGSSWEYRYTAVGTAQEYDVSSFFATLMSSVSAAALLTALGISPFIQTLLDDSSVTVARATLGVQEQLTANRTYYVASTGNNNNTGLATSTTHAATFTNGSANIGWTGHGRSVGDVVVFTTTGSLPTNFTASLPYYVKQVVDADTITVSLTSGGSAVSAGSAGSGTHTATLTSPFLTLQKALDTCATINFGGKVVTISVAGGTFGVGTVPRCTGQADATKLIISGAGVSNTTLSNNQAFVGVINCLAPAASCTLRGVSLSNTTANGYILQANKGGYIGVDQAITVSGTDASTTQIFYSNGFGSKIDITANVTISADAARCYYATAGGTVSIQSVTVTYGTRTFTYTAYAESLSYIFHYNITNSGTVTSTRYASVTNSVIQTFGGGASAIAGSTGGSTATGGQYA